ncbi:MAG: hypothetical protein CYPHOPRED_000529 [Cyphobasidiales sp. Tagirdzhanova-0007]|nr:MAG: hypothetical protein CYPHOPRED_000529 [Cyphobasidiales sp. Tagirdzhanova-0007]
MSSQTKTPLSSSGSVIGPDHKNKLSWSTPGSVEKNLPHLVQAHTSILSLPEIRTVLEVASGFGDHLLAYAEVAPKVEFWPTECNHYLVSKLQERFSKTSKRNVKSPRELDVLEDAHWEGLRRDVSSPFDFISVTNLLNVTPWQVTQKLFQQIGRLDRPILNKEHGILAVYCCLKQGGEFLSEKDKKFDANLRSRDPEFGIRNLDDIVTLATAHNLHLATAETPGGGTNLFLLFKNNMQ